jgi:hypothetical protein
MTLTKKDFEKIGEEMAIAYVKVQAQFFDLMQHLNPRFNKETFIAYVIEKAKAELKKEVED